MKYKIGQKVISASIKCLVIATKVEAYNPQINPYNRSKLYPENDYLLIKLKDIELDEYNGILDVIESQIEKENW